MERRVRGVPGLVERTHVGSTTVQSIVSAHRGDALLSQRQVKEERGLSLDDWQIF